jgi:hypothetical protein
MGGLRGGASGEGRLWEMEMGMVRANLTWPEWEVESAPVVSDLAVLPLFALVFLVVRFCLDKLIFEVGPPRCRVFAESPATELGIVGTCLHCSLTVILENVCWVLGIELLLGCWRV